MIFRNSFACDTAYDSLINFPIMEEWDSFLQRIDNVLRTLYSSVTEENSLSLVVTHGGVMAAVCGEDRDVFQNLSCLGIVIDNNINFKVQLYKITISQNNSTSPEDVDLTKFVDKIHEDDQIHEQFLTKSMSDFQELNGKKFLLVRHGLSWCNTIGKRKFGTFIGEGIQNRDCLMRNNGRDCILVRESIQEAKGLGKELKKFQFTHAFVSPMRRTIQTYLAICAGMDKWGIPTTIIVDLIERHKSQSDDLLKIEDFEKWMQKESCWTNFDTEKINNLKDIIYKQAKGTSRIPDTRKCFKERSHAAYEHRFRPLRAEINEFASYVAQVSHGHDHPQTTESTSRSSWRRARR